MSKKFAVVKSTLGIPSHVRDMHIMHIGDNKEAVISSFIESKSPMDKKIVFKSGATDLAVGWFYGDTFDIFPIAALVELTEQEVANYLPTVVSG